MGCCGTRAAAEVAEVGAESGEELHSWSEADVISRDLLQGFHYRASKSTWKLSFQC